MTNNNLQRVLNELKKKVRVGSRGAPRVKGR